MDFSEMSVLDAARRKMQYTGQRQRVLAQNVANGDTPGYRPMDLEPFRLQQTLRTQTTTLLASDPRHFASVSRTAGVDEAENRAPYEVAPAGNAVILEEQLMRQAENASQHQMATLIYQKQVAMFRVAIAPSQG